MYTMCLQHNKETKDVTTTHEVIQYKDHFSLVPKSNAEEEKEEERISQDTILLLSSYQPYSIAYCA